MEDLAVARAAGITPADPITGSSLLGPLVSAVQQQRVRDYINKGIDEGARLICGGVTPPEGLEKGYYVAPTIFSDVRNDMTIAQEEIFGPVLSIIPYDTEEEAIAIANDSPYGLAGGVWAGTDEKAFEVARKIRTGQVDDQRRRVQRDRPLRWLQAVGHRSRTRTTRFRGVPRSQSRSAQLTFLSSGEWVRLFTRR